MSDKNKTFYLVNKTKNSSTRIKDESEFNLIKLLENSFLPGDIAELLVVFTYSMEYCGVVAYTEKMKIHRQEQINETGGDFVDVKTKSKIWLENQKSVLRKGVVADPQCGKCKNFLPNVKDASSISDSGRCCACKLEDMVCKAKTS